MPSSAENIEFINKMKFYQNSNITNMLISNLFNVSIMFDSGNTGNVDNTKLLKIFKDFSSTFPIESLTWQIASVRFPSVSTDYETQYLGDSRYYSNYRDNSDILNIGFFEDANLNIRNFFKNWIDLTLANQNKILDENNKPYMLYPYQYDCDQIRIYPINGKYESNAYERYIRCHPISVEDKTLDFTGDVSVPIVSVSFVYKKFNLYNDTNL